ncbi:hypothetical protein CAI21_09035 [Alkalilimnicola ehrlichii]|uniref:Ubiquinone biosynthesis accessory factor UbiT n=1 Tax=Alkalilimnicola ehrlichii TaxID=351052 RepID=A0A3E0WWK2_9GAMM|nr:SCP2 sterol-binding domain-containing protein [Alkalilimnicola ehrlichii]RFA29952.1 hypothetical protein CAI21_09035 [Alkalilimnicola ehrlichii]RFA36541.1 hypothetical protein CAL65_11305 [Alkalilimnicola ehrlichii]
MPLGLTGAIPNLVLAPIRFLPKPLLNCAFLQVLNSSLRQPLSEGELDFLEGRCLRVCVDDLQLQWQFSLSPQGRLTLVGGEADVTIGGNSSDLLLLAARREDPDTLFFQRRLRLEGDTELGLYVKNLMDSLELDVLPLPLRWGVERGADWVGKK